MLNHSNLNTNKTQAKRIKTPTIKTQAQLTNKSPSKPLVSVNPPLKMSNFLLRPQGQIRRREEGSPPLDQPGLRRQVRQAEASQRLSGGRGQTRGRRPSAGTPRSPDHTPPSGLRDKDRIHHPS